MKKARTQAEAGISKRISEPVYPADILSDEKRKVARLATRGAWDDVWFTLCHERAYFMTHTIVEWGRFWGCSTREAKMVLSDMKVSRICNVTFCNGKKHNVTLTCRRLARRDKANKHSAERMRKHRAKKDCNAPVTPPFSAPSVSSSFSVPSLRVKTPPLPPRKRGDSEIEKRSDWTEETATAVIGCAPKAWQRELAENVELFMRYEPLLVARHILDLHYADKRPQAGWDAVQWLRHRLNAKSVPSDTHYAEAKKKMKHVM